MQYFRSVWFIWLSVCAAVVSYNTCPDLHPHSPLPQRIYWNRCIIAKSLILKLPQQWPLSVSTQVNFIDSRLMTWSQYQWAMGWTERVIMVVADLRAHTLNLITKVTSGTAISPAQLNQTDKWIQLGKGERFPLFIRYITQRNNTAISASVMKADSMFHKMYLMPWLRRICSPE